MSIFKRLFGKKTHVEEDDDDLYFDEESDEQEESSDESDEVVESEEVDDYTSSDEGDFDETFLYGEELEVESSDLLVNETYVDSKYNDVIQYIKLTHNASINKIQRKFWMSADRAALIVSALESASIIRAINDPTIYDDPVYNDVVKFVIKTRSVSANVIQHVFSLNAHRTKKIFDAMEAVGVISENSGGKRVVLA
jgi:DNA segregation ATPase FtsK/SpoIIIE-like protein